jgi:anti-anti-sigma regulatory factor
MPDSSALPVTSPALFGRAICMHARGELDIASAPQLALTLREAVSSAGS